jgi:hypothetical protein
MKINTIKLHADWNIICCTHWTLQCSRMLKYNILGYNFCSDLLRVVMSCSLVGRHWRFRRISECYAPSSEPFTSYETEGFSTQNQNKFDFFTAEILRTAVPPFLLIYSSAVQRSYVLGHNSLMPMEVRAPPHYYYYYYYYHYYHHRYTFLRNI